MKSASAISVALGVLVFTNFLTPATSALPLQFVSSPDSSLVSSSGSGDSISPIISADGRYVLFSSRANNLTTNGAVATSSSQNVYLRDRLNQTTTLISVNLAGTGGNADSTALEISTNGQYVLFESSASDLIANDTNNASDVFVRNLLTSTTTLASVSTNGTIANGASRSSAMTPDGRFVAFVSSANNLTAQDTNNIPDIFVRDLQLGTTIMVTPGAMASAASPAYGPFSELPDITPDGRYVAFFSNAANLVAGVTNIGEIYVRDLVAGTTSLASTNAHLLMQSIAGTNRTISYNHTISQDGSILVYEASPVTSVGNSFGVIFRHNLQTGLTEVINTNASRVALNEEAIDHTLEMTPDGRFIAYTTKNTLFPGTTNTAVYVWDAQLGTNILVSADQGHSVSSAAFWPAITPSGQFVAFISSNLTPDSLDGLGHIYLRNLQSSTTTLIDVNQTGPGSFVPFATLPRISDDGRFVAFDTPSPNLVSNDNNAAYDVFVRDTSSPITELTSSILPSLPALSANGPSSLSSYSVSTNGHYIAFYSEASNLVPNDTNGFRDVFIHDRISGTNTLVSVAANGSNANGLSAEPSISADGRYVAFSSTATNLVSGDTNKFSDVFVRDLVTGSTSLISIGTNGLPSGNGDSSAPIISADGQYVLFRSKANNLATSFFSSGTENLFFRDRQANKTYAVTTAGVGKAAMTPDGRFVTYGAGANVQVWSEQSHTNVFTAPATVIGITTGIAISQDGHHIAFSFSATPTSYTYVADVVAKTNKNISTATATSVSKLQFSSDGRYMVYTAPAASKSQVYLYDFVTGTNLLVSRDFNSSLAANGNSDSPALSPSGRFIAYRSSANNLVPGDFNGLTDLFLYDRFGGSTTLVSLSQAGNVTANNRSLNPVFSPDGQTLFFQSWASDLTTQDYNLSEDIFALNLGVSTFADTDGDGMDDVWEMQHFGTLARDGTGDFDGDGATDLFEFQTGTDPGNPNSFFHGQLVFSASPTLLWTVAPGKAYRVQYKDSLSDADWRDFDGSIAISGNQASATDTSTAAGQRFYRIIMSN
jgi:WD40-like Beta Propeller Repeat/Bacterial TSP3 repeat